MSTSSLTLTEEALLSPIDFLTHNPWALKQENLTLFNEKIKKAAELLCPNVLQKNTLDRLKSLNIIDLVSEIKNAMKEENYELAIEYCRLLPSKYKDLPLYIHTIVQFYIDTNQLQKAKETAKELSGYITTGCDYAMLLAFPHLSQLHYEEDLAKIAEAHIRNGNLLEATNIAKLMECEHKQDLIFKKIFETHIQNNNYKEAENVVHLIQSSLEQNNCFIEIIKGYLSKNYFSEAIRLAGSMKGYSKGEAFLEIINEYISRNDIETAKEVIKSNIHDDYSQSICYEKIALQYLEINNASEAAKITNLMKHLITKDNTTKKIIQKHISNDELPEALRLTLSLNNKYEQSTILGQIVKIYISKNMLDKAEETAHKIPFQYTKSTAFQMLIQKYIDLKNIPKTLSLLKFIDEKKSLIECLLLIASKVNDREKFYELAIQAEKIAKTEDDEKRRNEYLYLIIKYHISINLSLRASRLVIFMTDSFWKDRSYQSISTFAISQGCLKDAANNANHIKNEWSRSDMFLNILKANLNQSNIDQALKTISKITFKSSLVEALVELTLFYHNHYTDHPKEKQSFMTKQEK